jgi:hypothetical protein
VTVSIKAGPATAETDGELIIGLRASFFIRQLSKKCSLRKTEIALVPLQFWIPKLEPSKTGHSMKFA